MGKKSEKIASLLKYILEKYPKEKKQDLSKARINKLVYLADWKSALERSKQITPIKWYYNYYGPYVKDIEEVLDTDNRFKLKDTVTFYGNKKTLISLAKDQNFKELTKDEQKIINFIIDATKDLKWNEFINLIYSTYPVKTSEKHSYMNLIEFAKNYKNKGTKNG